MQKAIGDGFKFKSKLVAVFAAALSVVVASMLAVSVNTTPAEAYDTEVPMYRMYNSVTHEHLYTDDLNERNVLNDMKDWTYEGTAWYAPTSGETVYRLYNEKSGEHHYTRDLNERDTLVAQHGWTYERIGWYSGGDIEVMRMFNPAAGIGAHHYTTDDNEFRVLTTERGWTDEKVGWYGLRVGEPLSVGDLPNTGGENNSTSIVYVTQTGEKYHLGWCPTIDNSRNLREMTVAEAQAAGKTPCKVCRP